MRDCRFRQRENCTGDQRTEEYCTAESAGNEKDYGGFLLLIQNTIPLAKQVVELTEHAADERRAGGDKIR